MRFEGAHLKSMLSLAIISTITLISHFIEKEKIYFLAYKSIFLQGFMKDLSTLIN